MDGEMLGRKGVAKWLDCSPRHVDRMVVDGKIPRPVYLGALVRWPRAVIEEWIVKGCPPCEEEVSDE